ncbi:hypothetical protein BCR44DRAFT_1136389 [Catenaria anguillulae PL171]|uniref:Uncharacterized protein n=1 Tax=Catenaria anguillulae PL171 TaxID=765915 RepID=A0A1Y2HJR9_9FUNG|nr:hypothetical protein BCR44DRAFT_1136389 [Catenaria anguillulae PL171]
MYRGACRVERLGPRAMGRQRPEVAHWLRGLRGGRRQRTRWTYGSRGRVGVMCRQGPWLGHPNRKHKAMTRINDRPSPNPTVMSPTRSCLHHRPPRPCRRLRRRLHSSTRRPSASSATSRSFQATASFVWDACAAFTQTVLVRGSTSTKQSSVPCMSCHRASRRLCPARPTIQRMRTSELVHRRMVRNVVSSRHCNVVHVHFLPSFCCPFGPVASRACAERAPNATPTCSDGLGTSSARGSFPRSILQTGG